MLFDQISSPFINEFPGEDELNPMQRQTPNALYSKVSTIGYPDAKLIAVNESLLTKLGAVFPLTEKERQILNGNPPTNISTYATAYAGHQFGNWAGQLGDGRAIFLGEVQDVSGEPWELQYKGAGATPYSRRGDGRAVLRSTIREYLMSEAMFYLGIPTTRSVSISTSGEEVVRDIMYDGNAAYERGALMVRAAQSFLRFGHFEFLAANGHNHLIKDLADYIIQRYYPLIQTNGKQKYLDFFAQVQERILNMVIEWYRVGFVHGVMNTDNMSMLGLTIDYGPFAMLEEYDLKFTSNTTDLPGRRYAFGQQANIALWNLNALANAIFPLIDEAEPLQDILNSFESSFWSKFDEMMGRKLGLDKIRNNDEQLIKQWQTLMIKFEVDYTLFFMELMNLHKDMSYIIDLGKISYQTVHADAQDEFNLFIKNYLKRIAQNKSSRTESLKLMQSVNPAFVLRNYLLFEATEAAEKGDYSKFFKLWEALQSPYENKYPEFQKKRPNWADGVPGCSMLSCSS